jgi:PAS domain S-box-containing protein
MASDALHRLFFEESGDALVAIELPDGRIRSVNPAFTLLTGFDREEVIGESVSVLDASATERMELARGPRLSLDMFREPGLYTDVELPAKDGEARYGTVKVRHAQLSDRADDARTVALAVLSDDTERLLLLRDLTTKHQTLELAYLDLERMHTELQSTQAKMLQASKLMALGELAAGMSHELNQPLTGIHGFAQEIGDILRTQPRPSKREVYRLSKAITANAAKMARLLGHLRNFAARGREAATEGPIVPESIGVARAIENVRFLLARQLEKRNVRLEVRLEDPSLQAFAQSHPLEQILINLITNSRDALADKARREGPAFVGRILVRAERREGHVVVRVTDNGPGIPANIAPRIFDPFFTTKEPGQGLGLGLSISFGLAHRLQGELALESTSPAGTTFQLTLPAVAALPQPRAGKDAA